MIDLPERVAISVGQTARFELSAAWRGGYRWSADTQQPAIVAVDIALDPPPSRSRPESEHLVVRGLSPGIAIVEVRLARSWETTTAETHELHIEVHERGRR
jgi:hypothetical protein